MRAGKRRTSRIIDGMDAPITHSDSELFLNRELAQLEFNFRVLAQAADPTVPLLERLRYLCISCTNLDEFFEVRVATVLTALEFGAPLLPDRTPPSLVLERLHRMAGKLVEEQYRLWNEDLRPALNKAGIRVLTRESWNARQTRWLQKYFSNEVLPVLSPLGLDPAHPVPAHPQQEPQRGGGAGGQGRLRPQGRHGDRARAALAAAHHPAAPRKFPAASTTSCSCRRC